MNIGLVKCGYVADTYLESLKNYPDLKLVAVTDMDQKRASEFGAYHNVKTCPSVEALLNEPNIELIINLSDAYSHFEVTKMCLEAGKHVYSDKPMTLEFSDAKELVDLAERKGLYLSSAPCGILGETAQTLWRALKCGEIGTVQVVYAEYDDGPLHLQEPNTWFSPSGALYPYFQGWFSHRTYGILLNLVCCFLRTG